MRISTMASLCNSSAMDTFPQNNRTFQILDAASKGGYSVGAYNCYNDDGVIAVIRAAHTCRSPAIIQIFPWTIRFQGPHFVRYVIEAAHSANVPIAVHLDHCIEPDDVKTALDLPFDSVMIDASTLGPEENIIKCREIVQIANAKGIAIEAEMGRIEGGEDGLPSVDMETILTQPNLARAFVKETGVQFLAPAFGNIHGKYGLGGPEASWRLDLLMDVHNAIPQIPLVLHGTHGVSDELFQKIRKYGILKINMNRTVRNEYTDFVAQNAAKLELTELKMRGVEVYAKSIERVMRHVLGSAGKA
ncbi:aldolase [Hypoxylon sp. FL1857]|nr:aldolase [Hypoxylon sp. FL1857]